MAQIQYPTIDRDADILDWAQRLVATLQRNFNETPPTIQVGQMVLFPSAPGVPGGYLLCNGASFTAKAFPALSQFLGSNILPNLAGPAGFVYGIKV